MAISLVMIEGITLIEMSKEGSSFISEIPQLLRQNKKPLLLVHTGKLEGIKYIEIQANIM